jgi:Protein of unknown function (DUF2510)
MAFRTLFWEGARMTELATASSSSVFFLVLGVVFGVVAYRSSESFKKTHQVTPWHIPSWAWGVIGFISLLLWVILFLIARSTTKRPAPGAAVDVPASPVPPGWYPDPHATHEMRFWDGYGWTDRVEDGGIEQVAEL